MSLRNILANIPLFKTLDEEDLDLISSYLKKETHPKGTILFREGDVGDSIYLVESGQLAVLGKDEAETIAFIGPGGFVGEISILLAQPRTATLRVAIDAHLWRLSKSDFEQLVLSRASIAREMMQELGRRLVTTTRRRRRLSTRRITAVSGTKGLALAQQIRQIFKSPIGVLALPGAPEQDDVALSSEVIILDNEHLDEALLAEGLSYQVEVFKHILLLLPPEPDPLARKAITLADTVVAIGESPRWIETYEDRKSVWQCSETNREIARMARRLTNRLIGLALSSGGTRGLAHVGVIKVLMEEGIPIDLVAGTSGGALFGALFAAGWSYDRIEAYVHFLKTLTNLPNWDFNFAVMNGIVRGRRAYDKFLRRPLKDAVFEDLKTPLYIVAADILTGDEIVFESGSLADAIRASASVPILTSPWYYEDHFCSDGGIVNPLPATLLRDKGADIVLASSVIRPVSESYSGPRDTMPSILQSVFNIFSAMEAEVVKKQLPAVDVLIQHKVSARSTLDFENTDAILREGERLAREKIELIKTVLETPPEA